MRTRTLPRILIAQRIARDRVRLRFNDGRMVDVKLPIRTAVRVLYDGIALRVGPGPRGEISAWTLYHMRSRTLIPPLSSIVDPRGPRDTRYRRRRKS